MPSKLIKGALAALKSEPKEQKMLQGFYRGFAGEDSAAPEVFVTPQKRVADYYAQKRAEQMGLEPHAEMVLADPFAGRAYGHSTPGTGKQEPLFTRARKMQESEVADRTRLYADGGYVLPEHTQPDMADGGQVLPDPHLYAKGGLVAAFKDGGAATGFFPQMRPRRSKQDREAAKNVPVDLARGFAAGALGMPGDVESLIRMLPGLDESTTYLPTSEDIEKRLPFKGDTPVGRAASGLGVLGGGFYTGPGSAARAISAVPKAVKRAGQDFAQSMSPVHVVKPEGGDWLKGAVQRGVSGLKKYDLPDLFPEMGGPPPNTPANEAINKWIGSNLGNYLQKQMATPSDPVRKLAEEGITHIPDLANRTASFPTGTLRRERGRADFPEFGMGQSELAKKWENLADESIVTHRAGDIQRVMNMQPELDAAKEAYQEAISRVGRGFDERLRSTPGFSEKDIATLNEKTPVWDKARILGDTEFEDVLQAHHRLQSEATGVKKMIGDDNPWIAKLDPDAPAYHGDVYDLGFDHVVDVLGEMVASGRIRPDQLNKVSMEQAIRMTHQYNIEMAEKAAKATATAREGLPVYKEYPEGYRWVELNRPGAFASESEAMGHSVRGYEPPKGHADWAEGSGEAGHSGYGHGGWDAIKSGRAKVYSLVDEKGKPHVTVEVAPWRSSQDESLDEFANRLRADPNRSEEAVQAIISTPRYKDRVTQIKGKSNRAPNPEYLPFVQDFVKSGQWVSVDDLRNTGLVDTKQPFAYQDVPSDLWKVQEKLGEDASRYMTQDELKGLLDSPEGYAGGGSVKTGIKEGVDLARRSFFGLRPSQDMKGRELAPLQKDLDRMQAELAKAEKVAPKVEQKTTTVQPSPTAPKIEQTVRSVAETPVSRRTVLKTAAGQVVQNALPMQSFADLMKPAEVVKQAVQAAAPAALTIDALPALVGEAIRKGMSEKQAVDYVRQLLPDAEKRYFVEDMYHTYKNPELFHVEDTPQGPGEIMRSMMGMKSGSLDESPLSSMRPRIREMRERAPEIYDELRQTAKDIAEYGFEP